MSKGEKPGRRGVAVVTCVHSRQVDGAEFYLMPVGTKGATWTRVSAGHSLGSPSSLSHHPLLATGFSSLAVLCRRLPWLSFKAMPAPPSVSADLGIVLGWGQVHSKHADD